MMADGLGVHVLLLRLWQAWNAAGCSTEWCRDLGIDSRAMRFARDVRRQLENVMLGGQHKQRERDEEEEKEERSAKRAKTDSHPSSSKHHSKQNTASAEFSSTKTLRNLRKALVIGFANRVARRMPMHNGYRTLSSGETSTLAQLHPSSARLSTDEDGMFPEWIVYHELISTGRVFLNGVCPVEGRWVAEHVLPKLQNIDIDRLSGGKESEKDTKKDGDAEGKVNGGEGTTAAAGGGKARNDSAAVDAARARYLARKAAAAAAAASKSNKK